MSTDYAGRNVVVTGATGGLGEAVVRSLLAPARPSTFPCAHPEKARVCYAGSDRVRVAAVADLGDEAAVAAFYAGLPRSGHRSTAPADSRCRASTDDGSRT